MTDVTMFLTVTEYCVYPTPDGYSDATDPIIHASEESRISLDSIAQAVQDDVSAHVSDAEYDFGGLRTADVVWCDVEVTSSGCVILTQDGAVEGYADAVGIVQCRQIRVEIVCPGFVDRVRALLAL